MHDLPGGVTAKEIWRRFEDSGADTLEINQCHLAEQLGINRISVNRGIKAMVSAGWLVKVGPKRYQRCEPGQSQPQPYAPPASGGGSSSVSEGTLIDLVHRLINRLDEHERFIRETLKDLVDRVTKIEQLHCQALQTIAELSKEIAGRGKSSRTTPRPRKPERSISPKEFTLEPPAAPTEPEPAAIPDTPYDDIAARWNAACQASQYSPGMSAVKGTPSKGRRKAIRAAWLRVFEMELTAPFVEQGLSPREAGLAALGELFDRAHRSSFLCGETSAQGWKACFDWLLKEDRFQQLAEGHFDNRSPDQGPAPVALQSARDHELYAELLQTYGAEALEKAAVLARKELGLTGKAKPWISKVQPLLKDMFGETSTTGNTNLQRRRPNETRVQHYDRIHKVDPDFDRDVAFYREHGYELPSNWAERAAEREALARLDAEEQQRPVIEGGDCRLWDGAHEPMASTPSPPRALPSWAS